jgi:uncharacterized delta-60 repeat protein
MANAVVGVACYLSDGRPDPNFGVGGVVVRGGSVGTTVSGKNVAISASGNIIVSGTLTNSERRRQFMVMMFEGRFGGILNSFGSTGLATFNYPFLEHEDARAMTIDHTGAIVVGGVGIPRSTDPVGNDWTVARWSSQGGLLNFRPIDLGPNKHGAVRGLAACNSKVYGVGTHQVVGSGTEIMMIRHGDNLFMEGTPTFAALSQPTEELAAAACPPAGGPVTAVGSVSSNGAGSFLLARYTADGQLDTSLVGGRGTVITDWPDSTNEGWMDLTFDSGRIVTAGYVTIGGRRQIAIGRYDSTGRIDRGFGNNGVVTLDLPSQSETAFAIQRHPFGGFFVAGSWGEVLTPRRAFLAHFGPEGQLIPFFNGAVWTEVVFDRNATSQEATDLAIDGMRRVVVVGYAH